MADLSVKKFGMINPVVIASSPATQGARNVLKSAKSRPGAIVLRNFGHGAGGGSYIGPDSSALYSGKHAVHSHAIGTQIKDPVTTLEQYCEEVLKIKKEMDSDIKLWVSVGHYSDIVRGGDWEKDWLRQARELINAGADAIELHFNTPGVATAKNRIFDYYQLVSNCTSMIKKVAGEVPVMVKLAVENCDTLKAMRLAQAAGADAVGPTARWKAFCFDLDWRGTLARPGGGYGGTQANPIICHTIAEARSQDITIPMFAGGGVFSYEQALKILLSGSEMLQLGALACSGGVSACAKLISGMERWMDQNGYSDMDSLVGDALKLFNMPADVAKKRTQALGDAYRESAVVAEHCIGCERCYDVCWHDAIKMVDKKAIKTENCIGCGYCYAVCPTDALKVPSNDILSKALRTSGI